MNSADLLFAAGPIVLLIVLMTKPKPMPSARALPLVALVTYGIRLAWFGTDAALVNASVIAGLLVALTPILIVWGAIFLFRTMEHCGAMETIRRWLNHLSRNRVAQVVLIGNSLAAASGDWWPFFAAYLGALGSFFAGSCTISNLTFGPIQDTITTQMALDRTTILALQSVGGAMGNMVAIHNIVAVCSVLGLRDAEGAILKKTVGPMLLYGAIAAAMAAVL